MEFEQLSEKLDLLAPKVLVQELYFDNQIPFCFQDNVDTFKKFRTEICDFLNIHPQNFSIVGSAKTGYSLNTDLSKNRFGKPFDDTSDIDIVLVSEELFQDLWINLLNFQKSTVYKLSSDNRRKFQQLQHIFFWGLIRFDKLSDDFIFAKEWWDFFNTLSTREEYGPRRIRAGLYKSWYHVTLNYERNIFQIKELL